MVVVSGTIGMQSTISESREGELEQISIRHSAEQKEMWSGEGT